MGESQLSANTPELYQRLIDRLSLAMDVARTSVRLRDEMPAELELRGLSHAEFEVIKAYLESLPESPHASAGAYLPPEQPTARIIWLKDRQRTNASARSGTLPPR